MLSLSIRCFVGLALATPLLAQGGYQLPPPEVVEILDAAPAPRVRFSPDGEWILFVERPAMPSLAEVARPMLRLAGIRIDPVASARYRTGYDTGLVLRRSGAPADGSRDQRVPLAGGVDFVSWAPNSKRLAFSTVGPKGQTLFVVDTGAPTAPRMITGGLNTIFVDPSWQAGGGALLVALNPPGRGAAPTAPATPRSPAVQETSGESTPLRTYQDLLENTDDVKLFDYHVTTQLVRFELDGGANAVRPIGRPAALLQADMAPDGRHLLLTRLARPYSYLMPYYAFPSETTVFDTESSTSYVIEKKPLDAGIPIGGVRTGRRSVRWSPHAAAELWWVEAQDGGDPARDAAWRDTWFALALPFDGTPRELLHVEHRARGLQFTERPRLVISTEYDRDRRWTRSLLHDLSAPDAAPTVLDDRASRDSYADPGSFVTIPNADGVPRVRIDRVSEARYVFRIGRGASPTGLLPFLDRTDLVTGSTERLWQSPEKSYEFPVKLLPQRGPRPSFVTRRETQATPPNYVLHKPDVAPQALTAFPDPTPTLRGIHKELVTYTRADGIPLSATLYLPKGYVEGQKLPLLIWAYPLEYNDPATAGQVTASSERFTRVAGLSHLVLLTQGYAILDGATMPIVGDPETMNDHFIEQIVASAEAAIDFAVERGFGDRKRVAVGGHSYGAFMTANLLAHSDLFAAGIARSGAYNRTLTPFGFQSERRTVWEAPLAYFAVSPFLHADKIKAPLLLVHGEIDSNSGTFPMQSERLFQAIKGNGGTARLVLLPAESHGYRARESVLDVQAETIRWLDRFVKR
jgi:dipeptidyl aminopeptidase/acylaminoacyl peptidase